MRRGETTSLCRTRRGLLRELPDGGLLREHPDGDSLREQSDGALLREHPDGGLLKMHTERRVQRFGIHGEILRT